MRTENAEKFACLPELSNLRHLPAAVFVDAPGLSWGISNFGFASVIKVEKGSQCMVGRKQHMCGKQASKPRGARDERRMEQEASRKLASRGKHVESKWSPQSYLLFSCLTSAVSPSKHYCSLRSHKAPAAPHRCTVPCPSSTRCTPRRNDSDNNLPIHVLQCGL